MIHRKIIAALVFSSLLGCAPSAPELRHLGQLSQAARAACAQPGACPVSVGCIRAVLDATRPGAATRASYKAALSACDPFAAEVLP